MAFGNPYDDPYSEEIVFEWVNKLVAEDIGIISLADTVGLATPEQVYDMTEYLVDSLPSIEIGVHLHSGPANRAEKLEAAYRAGCLRFDGAIKGIGGCPMAGDDLVGNMDTEFMIKFFSEKEKGLIGNINYEALQDSIIMAGQIFV
jgi:hydroxymethylglutaryl-CoA lyase